MIRHEVRKSWKISILVLIFLFVLQFTFAMLIEPSPLWVRIYGFVPLIYAAYLFIFVDKYEDEN